MGQETTLLFNREQEEFYGANADHITITGLTFGLNQLEVSQGTVYKVDTNANTVSVQIMNGFPQMQLYPQGLWDPSQVGTPYDGYWLRRYTISNGVCNEDPSIDQEHYTNVTQDPSTANGWIFQLEHNSKHDVTQFNVGDVIGIKSKAYFGGAYHFIGSNDITFDHVTWLRNSDGHFVNGTQNAHIYDSRIHPESIAVNAMTGEIRVNPRGFVDGEPVCMASSSGGPQSGHPGDQPTSGNVVDGLVAFNTGDDSIAAFNNYTSTGATGIQILNSIIGGGFDRTLNMNNTPFTGTTDDFTLAHLFNCNSAQPVTNPPTEPSVACTGSDLGWNECVLVHSKDGHNETHREECDQ